MTPSSYNPLDSIGRLHNAGLDYILSQRADLSDSSQLTTFLDSKAKAYVDGFLAQRNGTPQGSYLVNMDSVLYPNDTFPENTSEFLALMATQFSSTTVEYLSDIVAICQRDAITNKTSLESSIIAIERAVHTSSIPDFEKNVVWSTCAVARYSNAYWTEQLTGTNTWFTTADGTPMPDVGSQINGGAVVAADAGGAARGAYLGAARTVFCTVVGGPGAGLISLAQSAGMGAIRASAAVGILAMIESRWNDGVWW